MAASGRPDMERLRALNNESRTPERLRAHYELERRLGDRLRASGPAERSALYTELYTELFASLPDHPQHRLDPAKRRQNTATQAAFLRRYLTSSATYVEIGCGDAAVTQAVAPHVREAIGVDVTGALVNPAGPANFRFLHTDGVTLDLPANSADLVYSNQLMEHLHPDDADRQLREICRVLKAGGAYICATPNRITGPHDISGYFGLIPTGFHMREYDHASLAATFRRAGFASARALIAAKGVSFTAPVAAVGLVERGLARLARAAGLDLAHYGWVKTLAGLTIIGRK